MSTLTELLEAIAKKDKIIEYMRNVVKAYTDTYNSIGEHLPEFDEDEEPTEELQDAIELCFDQIQPLLTLYEDTKSENIDKTLEEASKIHCTINRTLN